MQPLLAICSGSPREIGQCQGEQLAETVRRSLTLVGELEAFRLGKPFGIPFSLYHWIARRKAARYWRKTLASQAPDMTERLLGLSEGSRASLDSLQLLNLLEPVMSDLRECSEHGVAHGCSAVAVRGTRSTNSSPVIARNFDYLPLVQPLYSMREMRPTTGYRSIEFTVAPLVGAVDGINEAGLAITNNYAFVRDTPSDGGTITMAISDAMARCATVEESIRFFADRKIWGGGILMLADASGDLASLELSNTRQAVRRPAAGEDVIVHTNRLQADSMRSVELAEDAHYSSHAPKALRGVRVHASSSHRERRMHELLADARPLSLSDLQTLMGDHGAEKEPSRNTICVHSNYWYTTACLQLQPRERKMRVAFGSPCTAQFTEFGFRG